MQNWTGILRSMLCGIAGASLLVSSPAMAWDGVQSGHIARVEVADSNNFDFRVVLDTGVSLCGGSSENNWAYLNESDSNYKVYVATLLAAKASMSTVTLYLSRVTVGGTAFCHIGYVAVQ